MFRLYAIHLSGTNPVTNENVQRGSHSITVRASYPDDSQLMQQSDIESCSRQQLCQGRRCRRRVRLCRRRVRRCQQSFRQCQQIFSVRRCQRLARRCRRFEERRN